MNDRFSFSSFIFSQSHQNVTNCYSENWSNSNSNNHFPHQQFILGFKIEKPWRNQDKNADDCKNIQPNKSNRNMAVPEFVLVQQIKNAEELEDENCGGNDGFFVHFFKLLLFTISSNISTQIFYIQSSFPVM